MYKTAVRSKTQTVKRLHVFVNFSVRGIPNIAAPADCRRKFLEGLDRVENEYVDITIGNHVGQNDTVGKLSRLGTEADNPFIDPTEWKRFIAKYRGKLNKLNEEDPYEISFGGIREDDRNATNF